MHRSRIEVFLAIICLSYWCKCQDISVEDQIASLLSKVYGELAEQRTKLDEVQRLQISTQKELEGLREVLTSWELPSCKDNIGEFLNFVSTDECTAGTHNCSRGAKCNDKLFSFSCSCLPGYSGDGYECLDIDECNDEDICGSHSTCMNTEGSYQCYCSDGYKMTNNRCQDIDECENGSHDCQEPLTCVNSEGSYSCMCLPPFKGDESNCELECVDPSLFMENLGCITPVFRRLPWEDAKRACEKMGSRLLELEENSQFIALNRHFRSLMADRPYPWIGFKNKAWVSSGRRVSDELVATQEDGLDGGCGNVDLRMLRRGLWDASCFDEEFALCQRK